MAVFLFERRHRSVAPHHTRHQRTRIHFGGLHLVEICFGCGIHDFYIAFFHQFFYVGKIFSRRSAAVISHAPTGKSDFRVVFLPFDVFRYFFRSLAEIGIIFRDTARLYAASVVPFPDKIFGGQFQLRIRHIFSVRAHKHISVLPAFRHNLYDAAGMSERIEVHRRCRFYSEFFAEIHFAFANLAHNSLAARHKTIGL